MPTSLAAGQVHAWFRATGELSDADIASARQLLSDDERARADRFVFERDRRDFAAAHALLRSTLSRYADVAPAAWQFVIAEGGKPRVAPALPLLSFNLSHTHGLVACVVALGCDVGIDVESIDRRVDPKLAVRFFSPSETDWIDAAVPEDRSRRFLELWTLKEAYLKAIGKGLSHPLDTIVFEVREDGVIAFRPPADVDAAAWQFALCAPTARHCLALAVRRGSAMPAQIEISACR